ncbi:MAG: hypothetical protein VXW28_08080, partial [Candidatus Thermoplasmatota archaeon]|nr:hypothetical protein [Candidatus Thermoplasmatota archaeon]
RLNFFDHVVERGDMRKTLKHLRSGKIIWYAPDQDYGIKHSVFAPFFASFQRRCRRNVVFGVIDDRSTENIFEQDFSKLFENFVGQKRCRSIDRKQFRTRF